MTQKNYAHQILQNCSFKELDLSGANFSGSDLRGCDFTGATLVGANFAGVRTGLSRHQVKKLIIVAIIAPLGIMGLIILVITIFGGIFGDRFYQLLNFLSPWLPLLVLFFEILFPGNLVFLFPRSTNWIGVACVAGLFQIMMVFNIFLVILSFSNFGDGSWVQGLFLLLLAGICGLITRRIFKWVRESIYSSCGTSFRQANLTDANLSQAVINNTDFCFAILTGACISEWIIQRHTQFVYVNCEYVYLESNYQKRLPAEGKFRQGEVEGFLSSGA